MGDIIYGWPTGQYLPKQQKVLVYLVNFLPLFFSRRPSTAGGANLHATPAQSGLLFRIENFFCLGSPLSVFLTLRWRDPQNQEYHEHILPRSLCKYLFNVYHPCDPVAYRVEPIFMKFYSQIEPVHLFGADDPNKMPYR